MKVMIVSDSHGHMGNITMAIRNEKPLDLLIHCGDAEGTEGDISLLVDCPFYCVRGNNDYFTDLKKEFEIDIAGYKAMITHGHNYYVSMGTERIVEEAMFRDINLVFFGHTHRPVIEHHGPVTVVNPGSISYPRQQDRKFTYAIMNIEEGKLPEIEVKSL